MDTKQMNTLPESSGPDVKDINDFRSACEKTRHALLALAAHWRKVEDLAQAVVHVAENPAELSPEGYAWSQEVGLAYVIPTGAQQCRPVKQSLGHEGLRVSTVGGPPIQAHKNLIVAPAPPCGFGVFTTSSIQKGEQLGEYVGEARRYDIWCDEIKAKKVAARGSAASSPFIQDELYAAWSGTGPTGAGVVIDAHTVGNAMRFINCSCKPNCSFKKFGNGPQNHYRLKVVALRDISAWEQLSVDYGWYNDDPTLAEIRAQALEAYRRDLPMLRNFCATSVESCARLHHAEEEAECLEAIRVLTHVLCEARGLPGQASTTTTESFLRRFVDPQKFADFLQNGGRFDEVLGFRGIPEVVWYLYEVVGAGSVGISCRCALNPSLNPEGQCSGIIGRPLQIRFTGRDDVDLSAVVC